MSSKQLESILSKVPSATVPKMEGVSVPEPEKVNVNIRSKKIEMDRLVAVVPKSLKDEIKKYMIQHGETEKSVILKALKTLGFKVEQEWLVDKRTTR